MDVRTKNAFSCGPGGGEKLFDPRASGRKGQECPREIWITKIMFMLFSLKIKDNGYPKSCPDTSPA